MSNIGREEFIRLRRRVAEELAKNSEGEVITKVIPFPNDDVPRFLERLRRFEKASSRCKIVAEYSCCAYVF